MGQIVKHKARSSSVFTKQSTHANRRLKIKGQVELQLAFGLNLIKLDRVVMIYKMINGLCPDNLKGGLVTRFQISNYSTRNCLHLDTSRQNLEFSKKSFFYCDAQTWNEIPLEIRMSSTITTPRKRLKEFLHN